MTPIRNRRTIRRIVIGILIPVVLLCLYVSAYFAAAWVEDFRYAGDPIIRNLAVFHPLRKYAASRAPGSLEFQAAETYFANGGRISAGQTYEVVRELRDVGRL